MRKSNVKKIILVENKGKIWYSLYIKWVDKMEMNEEKNIGNNLEKDKKKKNYIIIGVIICL